MRIAPEYAQGRPRLGWSGSGETSRNSCCNPWPVEPAKSLAYVLSKRWIFDSKPVNTSGFATQQTTIQWASKSTPVNHRSRSLNPDFFQAKPAGDLEVFRCSRIWTLKVAREWLRRLAESITAPWRGYLDRVPVG